MLDVYVDLRFLRLTGQIDLIENPPNEVIRETDGQPFPRSAILTRHEISIKPIVQ